MFWQLTIAETEKILKRKILWVQLGILGGLLLIVMAAMRLSPVAAESAPQALWPRALVTALEFGAGPTIGGFIVVILVGAVVAQEYAWRTVQTWLSNGISRTTLLGAKALAFVLPLLAIVLVPLLLGGTLSAIFTMQAQSGIDASQVDFAQLGLGVLRTSYTLLPFAALAFTLAVVGRSAVTAIGGGVALVIGESVSGQILALFGEPGMLVVRLLPSSLSTSVLSANQAIVTTAVAAPSAPHLSDPAWAALGIALYTTVLLAAAGLAFRRQDLAG